MTKPSKRSFGLEAGIIEQLDDTSLTSLLTSAYGIDTRGSSISWPVYSKQKAICWQPSSAKRTASKVINARWIYCLQSLFRCPTNLEAEVSSKINALQKKLDIQD